MARHPHQDSRAGSLTAAMFWPSSSSAAKGTFRYARVPAFALGSSPSPRGSRGPSRGLPPSAPFRASSRLFARRPTARDASRQLASRRDHPGTPPHLRTTRGRLFPPPARSRRSRASRRHPVAFRRLRLLAHRRCRSKTRNPARRSTTPPARARLCVSTSTRRSARGT